MSPPTNNTTLQFLTIGFMSYCNKKFHDEIYCMLQVGTAHVMITKYGEALHKCEEDLVRNEEAVSIRYEKVCRVMQVFRQTCSSSYYYY